MEDVRIGRKTIVTARNVVVAITSTQIVMDDPKRVMLMIFTPNDGTAVINPFRAATATDGAYWVQGAYPLDLNIVRHGDIVTKSWHAISLNTPTHMLILEGHLEPL